MLGSILLVAFLFADTAVASGVENRLFKCNEETGFCERQMESSGIEGQKQALCLLTCWGTIWPTPSSIKIEQSSFDFCDVVFKWPGKSIKEETQLMAQENFLRSIDGDHGLDCWQSTNTLTITIKATGKPGTIFEPPTLDTDESYALDVKPLQNGAEATIVADNFFGARHALETLTQLITVSVDMESGTYGLRTGASDVEIQDAPLYPYRGVMLDISRHFVTIDTIKNVIRAMGYNKLNRLHLHLTDTASFPLDVPINEDDYAPPTMSKYGAYGERMMFDAIVLSQLAQFAKNHGVAIVPEIDTPSHTNMGWQWGPEFHKGDLVICTTDWVNTALEPPGGHLNIANEEVYPVLRKVYDFTVTAFQSPDLFHIGGDEVVVGSDDISPACWNSSTYGAPILDMLSRLGYSRGDSESFVSLWQNFTHRAVDELSKAYIANFYEPNKPHRQIIWGGGSEDDEKVTINLVDRDDVVKELPPEDYVVEVWDTTDGSIAPDLLNKGYDVILANYDYVYLDCGQPGFTNPGGYWCQPYHEWQRIYQYLDDVREKWSLSCPLSSDKAEGGSTRKDKDRTDGPAGARQGRILGSEVLVWGEESGESTLQSKLWPRAAALAEALWSSNVHSCSSSANGRQSTNPGKAQMEESMWYRADPRMQVWRNKLALREVGAAELQPLWCTQNGPYSCTIDTGTPQRR